MSDKVIQKICSVLNISPERFVNAQDNESIVYEISDSSEYARFESLLDKNFMSNPDRSLVTEESAVDIYNYKDYVIQLNADMDTGLYKLIIVKRKNEREE